MMIQMDLNLQNDEARNPHPHAPRSAVRSSVLTDSCLYQLHHPVLIQGYGDSSTTKGSDGRRSPDGGGGDGSAGDASYGNMYESFGSEEYVYEDDDGDELLQVR